MSRNVPVALLGLLVFMVVAGAIYLQIWSSARQTDLVWTVTSSVAAGDELNGGNVKQVVVPRSGESLDYYNGDLANAHRRASHDMTTGTLVFRSDFQSQDMALVTLSLRTPPPLTHGNTIDVYALVNNQTMFVGRRLAVDSVNGTSVSVWVPASDEPYWVTLAAGNIAMYGARSSGIGVPQTRVQSVTEALSALTGASTSGSGGVPTSGPPTPIPTPVPTKKP
jgi:hypothetical protein